MAGSSGGVVVVGGGVRGLVDGGCVGGGGFLVCRVSVFVSKESSLPRHRPWSPLLLPMLPAERCETSTFLSLRRHLPVLLPVHPTTNQNPALREMS